MALALRWMKPWQYVSRSGRSNAGRTGFEHGDARRYKIPPGSVKKRGSSLCEMQYSSFACISAKSASEINPCFVMVMRCKKSEKEERSSAVQSSAESFEPVNVETATSSAFAASRVVLVDGSLSSDEKSNEGNEERSKKLQFVMKKSL